jgi:hypothetical protein
MRDLPDRLDTLAARMADDLQEAAIVRAGAKEIRSLREGLTSAVKLSASRGAELRDFRDRHEALLALLEVLRLEADEAGRSVVVSEEIVRDLFEVLSGHAPAGVEPEAVPA